MSRILIGILLCAFWALPSLAAKPLKCQGQGKYKLKVCNLPKQKPFKLKGTSVGGITSKKGCASGSFHSKADKSYTLIVDGQEKPSYTTPECNKQKKGQSDRDKEKMEQARKKRKAEQARKRREQELAKKRERERRERQKQKAREAAERKFANAGRQEARHYANKFVKTYGAMENYRYFFARSFHRNLRRLVGGREGYKNMAIYSDAYDDAIYKGERDGVQRGESKAQTVGSREGRKEAIKRFKQASMDPTLQPDLTTPQLDLDQHSMVTPRRSEPGNLRHFAVQYDDEFIRRIGQRNYYDDDRYGYKWELIERRFWSLSRWLDQLYLGYDLGNYYNTAWAFDNWRNGHLLRGRWRSTSERDKYFSGSYDERAIFERAFKRQFNQVIDSKYRTRVTDQYSRQAREGHEDGEMVATGVARAYAEAYGEFDGYVYGFQSQAQRIYRDHIEEAVQESFEQTVRDLSSGVVLDTDALIVRLSSGPIVGPGEKKDLIVSNIVNIGLGTGEKEVILNGTKLFPFSVDFTSSAMGEDLVVPGALVVPSSADEGSYTLNAEIDGKTFRFTVRVTVQSMFEAMSSMQTDSPEFKSLLQKLTNKVKKDWRNIMDGSFDSYEDDLKKGTSKTALGKMVQAAKSLNVNNEVRTKVVASFKTAIGKRPGGWRWDDRSKWQNAMALIQRIR